MAVRGIGRKLLTRGNTVSPFHRQAIRAVGRYDTHSHGEEKMVELKLLPIARIRPSPFQAREAFDKELIEQLADSMKTVDLLQPIIVRPHKDGFQLAAGERRWRAAKDAGWDTVPAIVRELDDLQMQLFSLVENLHRVDLAPAEREKAVYELWKEHYEPHKKTQAQLAKDLGLGPQTVSDLIAAHEERTKIRSAAVRSAVTTQDLRLTRGLEEPVRKELLEKKAKGEIGQKELEDITSVARVASPARQRTAVAGVMRETRKARELVEVAK